MLSCSEHIPDQHEQLYLDTADSLKLYKDFSIIQSQLDTNEMVSDYLVLTFDEFKEKHDVDSESLDVLSKSLQTTIEISKTLQSIEDNTLKIEALERSIIDTEEETDYSFNSTKENAFEAASDTSFEVQVMMAK